MSDNTQNALSAILFMQSGMVALDAYSSFNSSPWTAENTGADAAKAHSCRIYVGHALVNSMAYALVSAFIAESWWPVIGAGVMNVYMVTLYESALRKGKRSGSKTWGNAGSSMSWGK